MEALTALLGTLWAVVALGMGRTTVPMGPGGNSEDPSTPKPGADPSAPTAAASPERAGGPPKPGSPSTALGLSWGALCTGPGLYTPHRARSQAGGAA